tara:strand:+ start:1118 stop:1411 length:294 start_codon:yes stop_codon:yes gene_type:complete
MNKPTFTKGPWASEDCTPGESEGLCFAINSEDTVIARTTDGWNEARANARLIASAPELFDALKAIYEIDVPDAEWSPTLEKCFGVALDAIAKVEGEK